MNEIKTNYQHILDVSFYKNNAYYIAIPEDLSYAQEPWPQNVKLFQPNEVKQILLPDSSNCLAVQTYLKMCNLPFQIESRKNAEYMSPSGKVPFIKCGAFVIAELEPIIGFIHSKGISLSNDLDAEQKADMRAYMSLVNNVLANAELYICWCEPTTLNEVTKPRNGSVYPWPLNHILNYSKRNQTVKRLGVLGWAQKSIDEVYKEIENCCNALSQRLGNKDYFFGSKPTELDALVFGHVFSIIQSKARILSLANILNKFPKLLNHKNMVYSKFGPPPEWRPTVPDLYSNFSSNKIKDKISLHAFAQGENTNLLSDVYTIKSAQNIQKRQNKICLGELNYCKEKNNHEILLQTREKVEDEFKHPMPIETILEKKIISPSNSKNYLNFSEERKVHDKDDKTISPFNNSEEFKLVPKLSNSHVIDMSPENTFNNLPDNFEKEINNILDQVFIKSKILKENDHTYELDSHNSLLKDNEELKTMKDINFKNTELKKTSSFEKLLNVKSKQNIKQRKVQFHQPLLVLKKPILKNSVVKPNVIKPKSLSINKISYSKNNIKTNQGTKIPNKLKLPDEKRKPTSSKTISRNLKRSNSSKERKIDQDKNSKNLKIENIQQEI